MKNLFELIGKMEIMNELKYLHNENIMKWQEVENMFSNRTEQRMIPCVDKEVQEQNSGCIGIIQVTLHVGIVIFQVPSMISREM